MITVSSRSAPAGSPGRSIISPSLRIPVIALHGILWLTVPEQNRISPATLNQSYGESTPEGHNMGLLMIIGLVVLLATFFGLIYWLLRRESAQKNNP
jgi:hypothetical protein